MPKEVVNRMAIEVWPNYGVLQLVVADSPGAIFQLAIDWGWFVFGQTVFPVYKSHVINGHVVNNYWLVPLNFSVN